MKIKYNYTVLCILLKITDLSIFFYIKQTSLLFRFIQLCNITKQLGIELKTISTL